MREITKSFSGVKVLDDVNFEVVAGEVHALAGGNGAGKSTLMKILQGVYSLEKGTIEIAGKPCRFGNIHDAKRAGLGMVFQEFSLVPTLTVAQNIFLNDEPRNGGIVDDRQMIRRAQEIFERMQVKVDPTATMASLSTAYWQLTEIAKALAEDARVLIMDEPTAALAQREARALFDLIERLTNEGIAIVYISHRMEEVYQIADRITILRNGKHLLTSPLSDITPEKIVEGIVGRTVAMAAAPRRDCADHPVVLSVEGLAAGNGLHDVAFQVHEGEVLGLAGLMGSGRTELARALFGIDGITDGTVRIDGREVKIGKPGDALAHGLVLVPEDRRIQGLVLRHSVNSNLQLPHLADHSRCGWVDDRALGDLARKLVDEFRIKVTRPEAPASLLSGGNQQKIVLAKWISRNPRVLVMDEPTAGVDIGTKAEIIETIRSFAADGHAVVVISSEYPELLAMSDRLLLMRKSTTERELDASETTDEQALELAVQGVNHE
jgi:monosaccharide ABC transporter ATP-binding protein, CUT2 family